MLVWGSVNCLGLQVQASGLVFDDPLGLEGFVVWLGVFRRFRVQGLVALSFEDHI